MSDLVVRQVTKTFETPAGGLAVLSGSDLEMSRGEAVAITGPSGSGKSTLLYIIGTLDHATSGNVSILGTDPAPMSPAALAKFRNDEIGFIFQDHHLLPQCSVLENVLLPTLAGAGTGTEEEQRATQLLERVGLGERLTHRPAQLSGGERQRVAVCRALINQPSLLLADEPTGNLDRQTATAVGSLLLELREEQNTMLITVTHSTELAERFPRWCELVDGKLVERKTTAPAS
ncbi:Lipoprotein-releasing system ATP-binding protein LolD [Symmachiella dynata]|uniref:ABC transporter ATP-binding protein n=1 Tax=Symmachiella dynata TaxID=2527995 RepID=UPI00118D4705|nr:ABC transporter ATP-binding protein [Symmachiella dynata]QDT49500.1 Lipoprotein-releasing system ATP-binding protein LolD [Symmachiella dynata]